jgi:hypothetical protein
MKAKSYVILQRAIEEGYKRGWHRAYKHTDTPTPEYIEECVLDAIMGDICDVFSFEEDPV